MSMYSSNTYTVFDLKISQYIPRLWDSKVTQYFLGPEHGPLRYFPPALATYETTQSQYTSPLNQISPSAFSSTSNEQAWSAGTNTNTFDQPQQELDLPTRDNENAQTGVQWLQGLEFSGDDIQDWSLNQLYHFENFQVAEDIFASQRFVEKYDESGNHYAGF